MDACDELGLFVIVATPGWQYWNKTPGWDEKVHANTRQIIRRDRNHPSVLMWEPILNETRYPKKFALDALQITREEYPYEGRPVAWMITALMVEGVPLTTTDKLSGGMKQFVGALEKAHRLHQHRSFTP